MTLFLDDNLNNFTLNILKYILENIDEKKKEKKQKELGYLKNQWKSIENYVNYKDKYNLRCSAEGNVSHILSFKNE